MKRNKEKKKKTVWDYIYRIILTAIILLIPVVVFEAYKYYKAVEEYESIPEVSVPATADLPVFDKQPEEWPMDYLFVEKDRAAYQAGQLRLIVPRMEVDDDVMDGTDKAALKQGPGLYTVAQMPGPSRNCNTSIAGHRAGYGRYGNIFKQIHTVKEGDLLYLTDKTWIYVYQYLNTVIVKPDDVSVLYIKDFPCLTLTSCDPIGGNSERIILTARLNEIVPYDPEYVYKESENDG